MTMTPRYRIRLRGEALLSNPRWNKGTAFSADERKIFGLTGRLPHAINTLDQQCARAIDQLHSHESDLRRNAFLQSMKAQNWVLYYALLSRHLRELMPIIYTPTEADAISQYSHLFRRSEGLYLTLPLQDSMEDDLLEQTRDRDIDLIVVSDAEAILGIGDQGVGGIGISTAKAAVYTLIGGVDPSKALAVTLDVGTNNEDLLKDELYVGWKHARVRGKDYDEFIERFVQLIRKHHPHCLLHFEDFGVDNAHRLLTLYREQHAVFNDDVQGTGAVTLAALMSAVGVTKSTLADQRIIIFGAGSAGLGIAKQLRDAMLSADNQSAEEANKRFWLIDRYGLIKESLKKSGKVRQGLDGFVRPDENWANVEGENKEERIKALSEVQTNEHGSISLLDVVRHVRPTVLIGTSTSPGAFTEEVVREMGKHVERPIIFPLSNPTRLVEVKPQQATDWTEGRALIVTGSPFPDAKMPNGKLYKIGECNNALIYPGLGLGTIVCKSRIMTDSMIIAGAQRLASLSPALNDPDESLLPDFGDAPNVNFEVAVAVAKQAVKEGSAGGEAANWSEEEVRHRVSERAWRPVYGEYVYDSDGLD